MRQPAFSVDGVLTALAAQPVKSVGGGRSVMFVAARRKEGVTSVACAVAQAAGPGSVYAIDLDLKRNALAKALSETGALGPRIDGALNGSLFFEVRLGANALAQETIPAFTYHRVGRTRVYAGVFDARVLPAGARVAISARPDYWNAARAGAASVVVDAPALERSHLALRVARHMDGVVLVVGADRGAAPAAMTAKKLLKDAGANVMGLVYVGATAPVMAIERLLA
jgi:Mrp family chromosome partitioning ATPase